PPRARRATLARPPRACALRGRGRLRRHIHPARRHRGRPRRRRAHRRPREGARSRPGDLPRARLRTLADARRRRLRRVRARTPRVIVRWGLGELPGLLAELGIERPFLIASERWPALELPATSRRSGGPSEPLDQ